MSMTHDDVIAVVQAHKEGRQIQYRNNGSVIEDWTDDIRSPSRMDFNFYSYDYRIKPEPPKPREWWITLGGQVWPNEELARNWFRDDNEFKRRTIHVREVLP